MDKMGIVAGLTVISLFASYKAYKHWQLSEVKIAIEDQSRSGIDDFTALPLEDKKELLLAPSVRLALVKDILKSDSKGEDFKKISQFDLHIQQRLFADRSVREYLIGAYQNKIDLAVSHDDFQLANLLAQNILQQYPDSVQLVSLSKNIKQQKISRQAVLQQQYQQCLDDQEQTLVMLFPCLQETRNLIRKIDSSNSLLKIIDSDLSHRYAKEVSLDIAQNELVLAETLVFNWQSLEQGEIASRDKLINKLAFANKVNQLIEQINKSNNIQLTELLRVFPDNKQALKQQVLEDSTVKERLLKYYNTTTQQLLGLHRFSPAKQRVDEGVLLFSTNKKELSALKSLRKKVTSSKATYLVDLEKRYKQELTQKEPNIKVIQNIQADIQTVAPSHTVTQLPKLRESYSKKIDRAIVNEQFDLADRLLNDWKLLKPTDAKSQSFIKLIDKKAKFFQVFQDRKAFTDKLKQAIKNDQLITVSTLIKELKNQLPLKQQNKVVSENKQALVDIYQQHIDRDLNKDKFASAMDVFTQMNFVFPKNKAVLKNKKLILKAKAQRIKGLLVDAQAAMKQVTLEGKVIFMPLDKIYIIDPAYFNSQLTIFKKLEKTLVEKLGQENSIPQIQNVFERWKIFTTESKLVTAKSIAIFRKTKNMIALRCLFSGRKFKAQNKMGEANKFFMFGLSLEPVNSVKTALEEELF